MKMKSLRDLLVDELKDLYSAETQLTKALPKMAKSANAPELREAFTAHLAETEKQIERLTSIFEQLEEKPGRKKCKAMEGLIEEGKELMKEDAEPMVHDAALIAAAQKVEHYEIASYGCAKTYALLLNEERVADMLQETLEEEGAADKKLTDIAMNGINQVAAEPAVAAVGADDE